MHVYYKMLIYINMCVYSIFILRLYMYTNVYIHNVFLYIDVSYLYLFLYRIHIVILYSYIYYLLHLSSASAFTNAFNSSIVPSVKPNSTIPLLIIFKRTLQIPVDSTRVTSRLSLCPTNLES